MKVLDKIKKWPIERKRVFAISLTVFLTILIIILSLVINSIGKDGTKIIPYNQTDPIKSIKESFTQIINEAKPILNQVFSSSTKNTASGTEQIIDQNNSASSSLISTSSIVE